MYVVTVEFEIAPGRMAEFEEAVKAQALNSLKLEPLCYRFDVCRPYDSEDTVFLYEVYRNEAAFRMHLDSAHFADFDRSTEDMVLNKSVKTLRRIWNNSHE